MNVNPSSEDYGRIVPWDSLTPEQQKSGDWMKLPATDENGDVVQARKRSLLDDFAPEQTGREILRERERQERAFDDATRRPGGKR